MEKPDWAEAMGRDRYGLFADVNVRGVTQRMRWIAPGRFRMGSPESEAQRWSDRELAHEVCLRHGFWLADTVCTQALWHAVTEKNPSCFKGYKRPVERVSWEDCFGFMQKSNEELSELALRFPTEAEWEYACRADTDTPFWFGDNITPEQVDYDGDYPYADGKKGLFRSETVEVMALPCNAWGLYQMHGNVWEWCADWFGDYPDEPLTDPVGADSGSFRVVRGGSWAAGGQLVRSAYRDRRSPVSRNMHLGFRFARGQKSPAWLAAEAERCQTDEAERVSQARQVLEKPEWADVDSRIL
ncbi:MAG: formylglycine-generating enzyme family protein [Gammaproteobacteria bacterium]|nr:formylglycine-generating enzyme family protein [Gammaproteobacteria bacterium]